MRLRARVLQHAALRKLGHAQESAAATTDSFAGGIGNHQCLQAMRECAERLSDVQHLLGVTPLHIVGHGEYQEIKSARREPGARAFQARGGWKCRRAWSACCNGGASGAFACHAWRECTERARGSLTRMQFFAQAIDLLDDPDLIRVYEEHHRAVWPKVVAALRAAGIQRMRIFRHGTRLFMYCEGPDGFDPARDYQQYAADPECRKWDELMRRFQRPVPSASADAWWSPMEVVFDLESMSDGGAVGAVVGEPTC